MTSTELKDFLDEKADLYNRPDFITTDPIQIPHSFTVKEDIEIAAFIAAILAWGNRKMIIRSGQRFMEIMGNSPYDFVMTHKEEHLETLNTFVHRTFNGQDAKTFIKALRNIYQNHDGLEAVFNQSQSNGNQVESISNFKRIFFEIPHLPRTTKHISDPLNKSAAKRINMMLRWLVRQDNKGVDLGIWKSINPAHLSCPLDVHSGNVARKLGLLTRKQNDAKALVELDTNLRLLNPQDPVKYDFALFGLGVFEGF
ncbi:TIGR02757 family protein [Flavobacterium sp. NRK F10]|uniref:TIGR02757 family protein n=1 Tax=Flavobacterium sp. NRK F10 TaxID=2954931 RepID=UPI002091D95F|nr:TIGR02757 family protein [Flavobacterium sp. NRK F10]MCO6175697.1 TIGR02757 family protein [Flavobacterium sp. NRK F10]